MIFRSFPVPPLECNCSIIGDPITKEALVVDPGGDLDLIQERLRALGVLPDAGGSTVNVSGVGSLSSPK